MADTVSVTLDRTNALVLLGVLRLEMAHLRDCGRDDTPVYRAYAETVAKLFEGLEPSTVWQRLVQEDSA